MLNKDNAVDAEVVEVSGAIEDPAAKRKNELKLIAELNNMKPKQRLAAISQAYFEDKISTGTMSFMLVEMFPFDPSGRFKLESMLREKYSALHPSLMDFDDAVESSQDRVKGVLKDRTV
jgi:hypothetical protein